ncbi:SAM-dependent methyltransferase [Acidovorax soli]|uniref:SAM-dependent methyltransferase n=1 Tax=Acidovorax soli TaxID=592050 RepID=A0A7X0UCC8_9BURK|nr:DUF938 domain-containing protein [Acidovorax soli]MBB6562993.1 SAM-dependent methyltransferase [Acidovorax soli]
MTAPALPCSPASERNQAPILAVLRGLLPDTGAALEIASGTGQHAAFFSAALPGWTWQPTDLKDELFFAIAGWALQAGAAHVRPAVCLDVRHGTWPGDGQAPFAQPFDLIYCANMLHIAPWACCAGLMQGAARHLAPGGRLVTYGPYLEDGVPTSPGNLGFDATLRAQDPAWGIRHRADVEREAAAAGLHLAARHAMPANNLLLVWQRTPESHENA